MVYVPFILDRSTGQMIVHHDRSQNHAPEFATKRNHHTGIPISSTISNSSAKSTRNSNSKNSAFENIFRRNYIKLSPFKPRKVSSIIGA